MLSPLRWTCLLLAGEAKTKNEEIKQQINQLIQLQTTFLTCIIAAGNTKLSQKAYIMVILILKCIYTLINNQF